MKEMVVHNDGSVRCACSKRIYKEALGGDGIDPCRGDIKSKLVEKDNLQGPS